MGEERGTIAFFNTYRPPVPLDIYSSPFNANQATDETIMTDNRYYNYNAKVIPPSSLKTILQRIKSRGLDTPTTEANIDAGDVTGLIFVSERTENLETLHFGIKFHDQSARFDVFNFAQLYGTFNGARLEDSGSIVGDYLVYVSTRDNPGLPHQPWNAVFRTSLVDGATVRLTPYGQGYHDLSPAVSENGKKVAIATFQNRRGWRGETEDLKTDIFVMNIIDEPLNRREAAFNGGWPSWAGDNILFFHRNTSTDPKITRWAVFRVDLSKSSDKPIQWTPDDIDAITPAAIDETTVAVATIRVKYGIGHPEIEREINQYRHIEIFKNRSLIARITETVRPKADHFSPFIIHEKNGNMRIGYHRCNSDAVEAYGVVGRQFDQLQAPVDENVGLVRVTGVSPSFSPDGSKLAFVDNEFKALWIANSTGLFIAHRTNGANKIFAPVWSRNNDMEVIYFCLGPAFSADSEVTIAYIEDPLDDETEENDVHHLTSGHNDAFPFTNPEGTKVVYRSARAEVEGGTRYKNLYIMDAVNGDLGNPEESIRLTNGKWTDTHCQWSPNGKWIAFTSNRDNPMAVKKADLPDRGFFWIYLTKADDPNFVPIKVIDSGNLNTRELFPGHCVHPCFSPKGDSLAFAADLAGVSVDPITMPLFFHSVRPYGDIFMLNLDMDDIKKNEHIKEYKRITHSRYEASTAAWTQSSTTNPNAEWNHAIHGHEEVLNYQPSCPFMHGPGAESVHMTGHLTFMGYKSC